jgi:hypothetical protein
MERRFYSVNYTSACFFRVSRDFEQLFCILTQQLAIASAVLTRLVRFIAALFIVDQFIVDSTHRGSIYCTVDLLTFLESCMMDRWIKKGEAISVRSSTLAPGPLFGPHVLPLKKNKTEKDRIKKRKIEKNKKNINRRVID